MSRKKTPSQKSRVIDYISEFGSITGREAFLDLGIMHLPSVIRDIKKQGYAVDGTYEYTENRYGDRVKYARYTFRNDRRWENGLG